MLQDHIWNAVEGCCRMDIAAEQQHIATTYATCNYAKQLGAYNALHTSFTITHGTTVFPVLAAPFHERICRETQ